MATDTLTEAETRVAAPPPPGGLYRLSVEQYEQMARAGILTKCDKVELIEGMLVAKVAKTPPLLTASWQLNRRLGRELADGWLAVAGWPLILARSVPEPDFMVLRGAISDYYARKPRPRDVALSIEIAHSSDTEPDRRRALFAEAGIPIYWIVHIPARRVEVYTDPTGPDAAPDYRSRRDFGPGTEIPVILDGREVLHLAVDEILPPPAP